MTYDPKSYEGGLKYSDHFRYSLADFVVTELKAKTVLELGCGPGWFLEPYAQLNRIRRSDVKVFGVDGCCIPPEQLRIPRKDFKVADLSLIDSLWDCIPNNFGGRVDVVISLEMLEHWPVDKDVCFFEHLQGVSPTYVVLSVAPPGQEPMPGEQHPNCQTVDEVIKKMKSIGYEVDDDLSDRVRALMLAPTRLLKGRPWADFYQRNTRVYVNQGMP